MSSKIRNIVEESMSHPVVLSKDWTGAASTSGYLPLKSHGMWVFRINVGAWAGGTAAVTLTQAKTAAGGSAKALAFETYYLSGTTGVAVETAVVSDTFNISAASKLIQIMVRMDDAVGTAGVDGANDFDFVQLNIASPGSNADLYSVTATGYNPRLQTTVDKMTVGK